MQYSIAFMAMLFVWYSTPTQPQFSEFRWLILAAIGARLIPLYVDPYTSNDVLRYLFDGRVALEGLDPYLVPHNAVELIQLREQWMPPAEHAKYPTLYPPLALALFSLAALGGPENAIWIWNTMTTAASLALMFIAYQVLSHADKLRHFPLIALSPLLILEAGEGMHIDIFTALVVLLVIRCWQMNSYLSAGASIGVGALIKVLPILLLLPLFILLRTWRVRLQLVVAAFGILFLGYGAALLIGLKPIGSLEVFFEKWRSGSPFFHWLEPIFGYPSLMILVTILTIIGFVFVGVFSWLKARKTSNTNTLQSFGVLAMQAMFIIPLFLSPVIFPWYLLPLVVLMSIRPSVFVLIWSFTLPFIYEVLNQFACCGIWAAASWPIHMIGISLLLALAVDLGLISKLSTMISRQPVDKEIDNSDYPLIQEVKRRAG